MRQVIITIQLDGEAFAHGQSTREVASVLRALVNIYDTAQRIPPRVILRDSKGKECGLADSIRTAD